jgi:hypothetical protein
MPFVATWPTEFEKNVVDSIRDAIGREIIWYIVASSTPCPDCSLDTVTNTSTDSFCPTCSGDYWINVYSGVPVSGHVTWGYSEQLGWVTGGQLDEGECRVQIAYNVDNLSTVDNAKWVEVDGKTMQIVNKKLRGVKEINRILVDLMEKED